MNRLLAFVPLLLLFSRCGTPTETINHPNVLFILADDFGYHDMSVTGSTFYETPNLDRIAEQGTQFTQGYATCQVCSPSRASIMSGKFPARIGITDWIGAKTGERWREQKRYNKLLPPANNDALPAEYTVLPEAFKDAGYKTFFAGKWHLGREGSHPEDHGFDVNVGGFHVGSPANGRYFAPFNNPKMADKPDQAGQDLSMRLAQETADFIKANKDQPFFSYLSFYAVHGPIQTTEARWRHYRAKAVERGIKEGGGYEMERRLPIRTVQDNPVYAGLVEQMDLAVGHVLTTLEQEGLLENTIVVFTSDNGGVASGDNYSTSNLPLRGGKGYQWEGGIREPYFVWVPWLKNAPKKVDTPVTGADFYPTLLDLAGLPLRPDEHKDGVSAAPLLSGQPIPERALYWHYPHYGNQGGDPSSIIRQGEWKLIHYWEDSSDELYNLTLDPQEQNDVAAANKERTTKMRTQLLDYLEGVNARFPEPDPLFNQDSFQIKQTYYQTGLHDRLERQRLEFLEESYQPNEDWWGSKVTRD